MGSIEDLARLVDEDPRRALDCAWEICRSGQAESKRQALQLAAKAYRLLHCFSEAELALFLSTRYYPSVIDRQERIAILRRASIIRRDSGDFLASARLLRGAIEIANDETEAALIGISLARLEADACNPTRQLDLAAERLRCAVRVLKKSNYPTEVHAAWATLIYCQVEGGESTPHELKRDLTRYLQDYPRTDTPNIVGALDLWLEGTAWLRIGSVAASRAALELARDWFAQLESPLNLAMASLDLLKLETSFGSRERVVHLAGELFPLFRHLAENDELRQPIRVVYQAALAGAVSTILIETARNSVQKAISRSGRAPARH